MKIEEVFKQGLQNEKMPVDQDLWSRLENRMQTKDVVNKNTQQKTIKTGKNIFSTLSSSVKTVIIVSTAGVLGVGTLVVYNITKDDKPEKTEKIIDTKQEKQKIQENESLFKQEREPLAANNKENMNKNNKPPLDSLIFDVEQDMPEVSSNLEDVALLEHIKNDYQAPPIHQDSVIKQYRTQQEHTNEASNQKPIVPKDDIKIKIPNVITPDGDGVNDCFCIVGIENYPDNMLIVYDRRGKSIFKQNHYNNNFCGQNLSSGAYFYSLTIRNGRQTRQYNGSLTIIK